MIGSDDEEEEPFAQMGDPAVDEQEEEGGLDDLFGDDVDEQPADENGVVHDSDEDDDDHEGNETLQRGEYDQFSVQKNEEPRELRVKDEDVVRHPPKFAYGNDTYIAKVPRFLHVDPSRFDAGDYLLCLEKLKKKGLSKEELDFKRLHDENTIRWRFSEASGETLAAESNSQFIEWEDGSFSLKLGDEYFDVLESSLHDTFLATYDNETDQDSVLYVADGSINKTMKFVPTSTNSKIHKKLTNVIKSRQQTKPGAQSVVIEVDPEKEARKLEKQFEEKVRERRRQQLKLEKEQEKGGGSNASPAGRSYTREHYSRQEEYDEEDEFIDDDEDEDDVLEDVDENLEDVDENLEDDEDDEDAAERLRRVKQQGAAKYEEDAAVTRKKRRVIEDDEDDE
jgi:RNA polymerase-associated protein LEO1